jgi:hypothetical protein
MKFLHLLTSSLFASAALVLSACQSSLGHGPLDGRVYEVSLTGPDAKPMPDQLIFDGGGFDSRACRSYGFTITNYVATREGDAIRFSADARNGGGETNRWEGVVRGNDVSGTMKHMNSSGKVTDSYDFVAKLAPKT